MDISFHSSSLPSVTTQSNLAPKTRELIRLAQNEAKAARVALAQLTTEEQVAVVCETPLAMRMRILSLIETPEDLVPLIPEAELCFTCKTAGIESASWLIALASPQQVVACVDLDAWSGLMPDVGKLDGWLNAIVEAGEDTIHTAATSLDPEMLAIYLRAHADVEIKPSGDEDWQPPEGGQTLEGQFYVIGRKKNDDLSSLMRMLQVLFQKDYWLYFRLMHSVREEALSEIQEWALRWRTGRLEDLGFPTWDRAMRIYGMLRPSQLAELPESVHFIETEGWDLPVWITDLPGDVDARDRLLMAIGELDEQERSQFFFAFIALANQIAVADQRDLGDAETLPETLQKAIRVCRLGLEHIAQKNNLDDPTTLRRVSPERLFRVGVNLAPEGVRPGFTQGEDLSDGEVE